MHFSQSLFYCNFAFRINKYFQLQAISRTMGTWVVFCTAQIPSETLEAFQTQSTRPTSAPPTPWILQQNLSEGVHGPELSNPAPSFITGFKDVSPTTLQTFIKENLEGQYDFPNFRGNIEWDEFVVLDKRSAKDNTCLVYHRLQYMPEGSAEDEWDKEKLIYEWKVWRVKFLVAWQLVAGLSMGDDVEFSIWEDEKKAYTDENGVLQLPYLEQDKSEYPDLEDRVPWGPGN
ncbi:hypothetical protein CJF31_00005618 [Rutstroemia sp. NJR-2017a BVV2]|nr:hypothetical protein CJF31_00005618 [Rutstroemia sp. NJR-2017a BVV2]